jgi:cysteine-rich repeat protein
VAGVSCDGADVINCAANTDGCLVTTTTDCTVGGTVPETCDTTAGPDYCTPCADDVGCETAAEGDTLCMANVAGTCTDTDQDTCLNLVEEECGDDFTCDAEDGCVYSGGDTCVETIPAARTLGRVTGSVGPFTTVGMTASDFGPYPANACPGQGFNIAAASPDLLFAVDVPAESVIEISLELPTPSTFTSNTWLFLLEGCAANAETMCSANSADSVEYTNQTDSTVRVYLVFDASTPTTGASMGMASTGMFGLEIDTRPLGCGDGARDGDEECDDANVFDDDGCSPTCELEDGYECTDAEPSVCTQRPEENVCGNVMCQPLPDIEDAVTCCTAQAQCGIAYEPYYGASCVVREAERPLDMKCPDQAARGILALFFEPLQGCCRADAKCGLVIAAGAGCTERTAAWTALEDGAGSFYWGPTPFTSIACTP